MRRNKRPRHLSEVDLVLAEFPPLPKRPKWTEGNILKVIVRREEALPDGSVSKVKPEKLRTLARSIARKDNRFFLPGAKFDEDVLRAVANRYMSRRYRDWFV